MDEYLGFFTKNWYLKIDSQFLSFPITFEHFRIIKREVFRVFVRKNICPHSFRGWSMLLNQIFVRLERLTFSLVDTIKHRWFEKIPKDTWSISKKVKSIVLVGPTLVRNLRGEFELVYLLSKKSSPPWFSATLRWRGRRKLDLLSPTHMCLWPRCVSFHEFRYVVGNISTRSLVAHFLLMLL